VLLFQQMQEKIHIIGLMSGTSKDGLDIAYVCFANNDGAYSFKLHEAETISYPIEILNSLNEIETLTARKIFHLDKLIGAFYASAVNNFMQKFNINPKDIEAIASHGQTIFHQPNLGFTTQIGCGSTLAYHTGLKVINDFRTKDILAGGQGAPLVPLGDELLFSDCAEAFLNIGGFTNISYKNKDQNIAFDICPGNIPINLYANKYDMEFDEGGEISRSGELNQNLLDLLNKLEFYSIYGAKSLGTEWLNAEFLPLLDDYSVASSVMRTVVEHEAFQIAKVLNEAGIKSVYITGGGAKNHFLIERIASQYTGEIRIPKEEIIDFKEAIIFGFLGFRYLENNATNCPNATGANREVVSGVLHIPG
jgi:anhydro-N-acetylmuramic acid kinase